MSAMHADAPADPHHALVVGAGPGIGAAVARRFAREGFRLTLVARHGGRLKAVAASLRDGGAEVATISADAGEGYSLREALGPVFASQAPGVIVYNAALMSADDLLAADERRLEDAYAVNVVGAIAVAQLAVPHLRAAGLGTLIFTGGGLADQPAPELGTLSLGKATLRAVATILAQQLEAVPVHVATVTVTGAVTPPGDGGPFDADRIGDAYWRIHAQDRSAWRTEYRFDGS